MKKRNIACISMAALGLILTSACKIASSSPDPMPSSEPTTEPSPLPSPSPSPTATPVASLQLSVGGTALNGTYNFASLMDGQTEDAAFTLTNSGDGPATSLALADLSAPYSLKSNGCGTSLAAVAGCSFTLSFAPTGVASYSSSLQLSYFSGTGTSNLTDSLSGMGTVACNSLTTVASQNAVQTGYWLQNDGTLGGSANAGYAVSFNLAAAQTIGAVALYLENHVGTSAAGTIAVTIHADNSGAPAQAVLGTSPEATIAVSGIPYRVSSPSDATTARFSSPLALAAGKYWIIIQATGVANASGITVWGASSGSDWFAQPYPGIWYWGQLSYGPTMGYAVEACQ